MEDNGMSSDVSSASSKWSLSLSSPSTSTVTVEVGECEYVGEGEANTGEIGPFVGEGGEYWGDVLVCSSSRASRCKPNLERVADAMVAVDVFWVRAGS
jgi:hypothetical protein